MVCRAGRPLACAPDEPQLELLPGKRARRRTCRPSCAWTSTRRSSSPTQKSSSPRPPGSTRSASGFHPLVCFLDRPEIASGEALSGLVREGRTGSNTTADHIANVDRHGARQSARVGPSPARGRHQPALCRPRRRGRCHLPPMALRRSAGSGEWASASASRSPLPDLAHGRPGHPRRESRPTPPRSHLDLGQAARSRLHPAPGGVRLSRPTHLAPADRRCHQAATTGTRVVPTRPHVARTLRATVPAVIAPCPAAPRPVPAAA